LLVKSWGKGGIRQHADYLKKIFKPKRQENPVWLELRAGSGQQQMTQFTKVQLWGTYELLKTYILLLR
jgi:hypothetical protein